MTFHVEVEHAQKIVDAVYGSQLAHRIQSTNAMTKTSTHAPLTMPTQMTSVCVERTNIAAPKHATTQHPSNAQPTMETMERHACAHMDKVVAMDSAMIWTHSIASWQTISQERDACAS